MPPPMQFSWIDLIGPILVVLVVAGINGARSFETAKIKTTAIGWYLRMVMAYGATLLPAMIVVRAISRAGAENQVPILMQWGWGFAASALVWAVIGVLPPMRRWLSAPSRNAREFERKSVA